MIQCGSCGKNITGSGLYCSECGQPFDAARARAPGPSRGKTRHMGEAGPKPGQWCPRCDESRPAGIKFCNRCGSNLEALDDSGTSVYPAAAHSRAELLMIRRRREPEVVPIYEDLVVGRGSRCGFALEGDPYVSPRHARFYYERGSVRLCVQDLDSLNGVYFRVRGKRKLWDRDLFRIGRHIFRLEKVERTAEERKEMTKIEENVDGTEVLGTSGDAISARLILRLDTGEKGKEYSIGGRSIVIGRGGGTHNFMSDKMISKTHARINVLGNGSFELEDLNSNTGTWVRLRGEGTYLDDQAELLIGLHRMRVRYV